MCLFISNVKNILFNYLVDNNFNLQKKELKNTQSMFEIDYKNWNCEFFKSENEIF